MVVQAKRRIWQRWFWTFYVDNSPIGIGLRNHPIDDSSTTKLMLMRHKMTFQPMHNIYLVLEKSSHCLDFHPSEWTWTFIFFEIIEDSKCRRTERGACPSRATRAKYSRFRLGLCDDWQREHEELLFTYGSLNWARDRHQVCGIFWWMKIRNIGHQLILLLTSQNQKKRSATHHKHIIL